MRVRVHTCPRTRPRTYAEVLQELTDEPGLRAALHETEVELRRLLASAKGFDPADPIARRAAAVVLVARRVVERRQEWS